MTDPAVAQQIETPRPSRAQRTASAVWRLLERAWTHPVIRKEVRGRMRGWRAPVVLTVHLTVLSCFASMIYFGVAQSTSSTGSPPAGQQMGQVLFYSTYLLLLALVVFLSPAFTAGTLSGERERKTLDLLITTLLPTYSLVLGKLAAALAYMLLLILAALPIQSLALVFGGITLAEVLIGTLILIATALAAGAIGLLVSTVMRSSIASTVLTYATVLPFTVGLPIVASVLVSLFGVLLGVNMDQLTWTTQAALVYAGGLILCTNPFATAIATKLVEVEKNSLLLFGAEVWDANGTAHTLLLISPWIVYVGLCVLLSAVLVTLSVLILDRKRG